MFHLENEIWQNSYDECSTFYGVAHAYYSVIKIFFFNARLLLE